MPDADSQLLSITSPDLADSLDIPTDADVASWRLTVPAKHACYALEDQAGATLLVATCADLRAALTRKLGVNPPEEGPTKRVNLREVVRRVRWRTVCGRFEADWAYMENTRLLMPKDYARLTKHLRSSWVCVGPDDPHPRFVAMDRPSGAPQMCFGPLRDGKAARRLLETLEDLFDLCRYHATLLQAPHGQPCAYKQMGRCPAPCDGTVLMESYRGQVRSALSFLTHREGWVERLKDEMSAAARDHRFEDAQRCKGRLDKAMKAQGAGGLSPLSGFRWVTLQRGDRKGSVRPFLLAPGSIAYTGQIDEKQRATLLPRLAERAAALLDEPVSHEPAGADRAGLAGHHLLDAVRGPGVFLHAGEARDEKRLREAIEKVVAGVPCVGFETHGSGP